MNDDIEIRQIKSNDVSEILNIGLNEKGFQVDPAIEGFWSEEQLLNWVKSENDVCLLAEHKKDGIIAFILFALHPPTKKVNCENGWVKKEYRGTELYFAICSTAINLSKKKGATYFVGLAKTDNIVSIKALEKLGFQKGYNFTWLHRGI